MTLLCTSFLKTLNIPKDSLTMPITILIIDIMMACYRIYLTTFPHIMREQRVKVAKSLQDQTPIRLVQPQR